MCKTNEGDNGGSTASRWPQRIITMHTESIPTRYVTTAVQQRPCPPTPFPHTATKLGYNTGTEEKKNKTRPNLDVNVASCLVDVGHVVVVARGGLSEVNTHALPSAEKRKQKDGGVMKGWENMSTPEAVNNHRAPRRGTLTSDTARTRTPPHTHTFRHAKRNNQNENILVPGTGGGERQSPFRGESRPAAGHPAQ